MRLGLVNYINALPFSLSSKLSFHFAVPTELNRQLREGLLDAALVSSTEYLKGGLAWVAPFGIAAHRRVLSVNLYVRTTLQALEGAPCAVTSASNASVELFRLLCAKKWRIAPRLVSLDESHEGLLLIGDEALRHVPPSSWQTFDLAEEWQEFSGTPFTFALFAARNEEMARRLAPLLEESLQWAESHSDLLLKRAQEQTLLPIERLKEYYGGLCFRLGEAERDGLRLFEALLQGDPRDPAEALWQDRQALR